MGRYFSQRKERYNGRIYIYRHNRIGVSDASCMQKCGIREIYLSVLSTFYESKLIAFGHVNRSENVLKFHGDMKHGNSAYVGSGRSV